MLQRLQRQRQQLVRVDVLEAFDRNGRNEQQIFELADLIGMHTAFLGYFPVHPIRLVMITEAVLQQLEADRFLLLLRLSQQRAGGGKDGGDRVNPHRPERFKRRMVVLGLLHG
ncbi:hypothetical protein D3C84_893560 [compost metagenome]